jgi:hypothetical protein
MKYVLTAKERRKQANIIYQFGKFISLSFKFLKLVKKAN